jgi:hypothetical protein
MGGGGILPGGSVAGGDLGDTTMGGPRDRQPVDGSTLLQAFLAGVAHGAGAPLAENRAPNAVGPMFATGVSAGDQNAMPVPQRQTSVGAIPVLGRPDARAPFMSALTSERIPVDFNAGAARAVREIPQLSSSPAVQPASGQAHIVTSNPLLDRMAQVDSIMRLLGGR